MKQIGVIRKEGRKMADRRMFSKTIIDSDAFIDMPISARLLYYDLSMRADDDGFVNSPKKIMKVVGATEDDMKILILKKFIIDVGDGIVVIKHWRIHNYIQKDRYKETTYKEKKELLSFDENNAYTTSYPSCIQDVSILDTQDRLEIELGKDRIDKFIPPTIEEVKEYIDTNHYNVDYLTFFNYYNAGNWKDAKGKKVKNWKQKVITWNKHDDSKKVTEPRVDVIPKYDSSKNNNLSNEELEELLKMRSK